MNEYCSRGAKVTMEYNQFRMPVVMVQCSLNINM